MIHILHHQHDTLVDVLTNKGEKVYWGDLHEIDIESLNTHQFTTTATNPAGQYLEKRSRYLLPAEGETYFHEFIIMEAVTRHDEKNIYAKASYHDLNTQRIIGPRTYTNWTVEQFVAHALLNTEWQVGQVEYFGIRSIEMYEHIGAYDFLIEIRKLFNREFEMRFRIETYGNKITGRYIDFVHSLGRDTKKEITYSKDLVGIEKRVYNERIVSQLIVLGPRREDGTRHQVTVNNEEAFQRWNRNGYHITAVYTPQVEDSNISVRDLTLLGEMELNARIDSIVEYSINAVGIEKLFPHEQVLLGDHIRVKDTEFMPPLFAEARVIHISRSTVDETQKTYTIGEVIEYNTEDIFKTFEQLQQIYGLRVVKNNTAPQGNDQIIWIDTSQTPNVPHTWNGSSWVRFAPIAAAEIGAETPQGAEDKAAAAAGAALDSATVIAQQEAAEAETAAKQAAAIDATNKAQAAQQAAIDTAAIDASTKAGQALDSATSIAEQRAAEAQTNAINAAATDATQKATNAQTNAQNYADQQDTALADTLRGEFQTFAEGIESGTIIVQSPTAPTDPVTNDLWIDISTQPYVWRRWDGSKWVNATATSLSELGGLISADQLGPDIVTADAIAANSISSYMIATAGLDAGVIKFGTMSGDRIAANTVDANRLKAGTIISQDIKFTGTLEGATGTFSGNVTVGNATDPNAPLLSLQNNGVLQSRSYSTVNESTEFIDRQVLISAGSLRFLYEANIRGMYLNEESNFNMDSNGLAISGQSVNFDTSVFLRYDLYHQGALAIFDGQTVHNGELETNGTNYLNGPTYFNGTTVELNPTGKILIPNRGTLEIQRDSYFGGNKYINNIEFKSWVQERGYCGLGVLASGQASGAQIGGVGVNFRYKKAYVPANIILGGYGTYAANPHVTDIRVDGFWLYLTASVGGYNGHAYWRGYYEG